MGYAIIYSPILFDFIKMKLSFKNDGSMIELKRIIEEASLQMVSTMKVHKSLKEIDYGFLD